LTGGTVIASFIIAIIGIVVIWRLLIRRE
jgi:hypothetical protein